MVIGIVGGMGSYATVNFFKRILDAFPGEKEWDRPRIIIDNYCTIPSRVRAILYGEKTEELVDGLKESIDYLVNAGADRIVVGCNTAHVFLPKVMKLAPSVNGKLINLIEITAKKCNKCSYNRVKLLASEGTYLSGIYPKYFSEYNIEVVNCTNERLIRDLIEDVKQNMITSSSLRKFSDLIKDECGGVDCVILGCTELPVLYTMLEVDYSHCEVVIDPLGEVISCLRSEYIQGAN